MLCWRRVDKINWTEVLQIITKREGGKKNIHLMKTNFMQYLSSVYFVNQPLRVSGIFVAHHQEVYCIYMAIGMFCAF